MYSYNNIIVKAEPSGKHALDELIEVQHLSTSGDEAAGEREHRLCDSNACPQPRVSSQWRWGAATSATGSDVGVVPSDDDVILIDNFLSEAECNAIVQQCEALGFTFWADPSATPAAADAAVGTVNDAESTHSHAASTPAADAPPPSNDAFRSAYTVEVHLDEFARRWWARLKPLTLAQIGDKLFSPDMPNADQRFERDMEGHWVPVGVCDNILFARYRAGGHFSPHVDGCNVVDLNTRTLYTVLVYLNTCEGGGETFILSGEQCDALERDATTGRYHSKQATRIGAVVPVVGRAAIFYYNVLHEGAPVLPGHAKYILRADVLYRRDPPILTEPKDVQAFALYQEARVLEADGHANAAVAKFQAVKKLSRGVAELYQL